jgi:Ca2+-binding RTX toxin-like protein
MGLSAFMGETSEGTWTLRLFDVVTGETATFDSFAVRAWGKDPAPDNQYVFTDEYVGAKTLVDAGGVDTLNAAALSQAVTLSLKVGDQNVLPNGSFTLAAGTIIENAFGGAGNDSITGNGLDNLLRGNAGNDTLDGSTGIDTAIFLGKRADYSVLYDPAKASFTVSSTLEGVDRLSNIEYFQFSDFLASSASFMPNNNGSVAVTKINALSVIVDKGVLGGMAVLLKDLKEVTTTLGGLVQSHTVEYAGAVFSFAAIDPLITTVTRSDEFTQEFRDEIAQAYPGVENILYADAVAIVGVANIDQILLGVAGFDGNFVS